MSLGLNLVLHKRTHSFDRLLAGGRAGFSRVYTPSYKDNLIPDLTQSSSDGSALIKLAEHRARNNDMVMYIKTYTKKMTPAAWRG